MSDAEQLTTETPEIRALAYAMETMGYKARCESLVELVKRHAPTPQPKPVDGELREKIREIIKQPMRSQISTSDIAVNMMSSTGLSEKVHDLEQLFAAHLQAAVPQWHSLKDSYPPYNEPVVCRFEYFNETFEPSYAVLKYVDEDDVCWRTADDNSEFAEMVATVTHWQPLQQLNQGEK
jgi:hypothetical protein